MFKRQKMQMTKDSNDSDKYRIKFHISSFASSKSLGTDLLLRFSQGEVRYDDSAYTPTVFNDLEMKYHITGGEEVTLILMDSAGQAEFDRLRPVGYPGVDVFVCLFNILAPTELETLFTRFIPEMFATCPKAEMILVGCFPEIRARLFHQHQHDILKLPSGAADHIYLTPEIVHARICKFHLIREFTGTKIHYIEYSARFSTGLRKIFDVGCESVLKKRDKATAELTRSAAEKSYVPTSRSIFRFFRSRNQPTPSENNNNRTERKNSDDSTNVAPQLLQQLDPTILTMLDYWCGPLDRVLFDSQMALMLSGKTLGVIASAFSLLRMIFRLHSDSISTASVVYEYIIPSTKRAHSPFYLYLLGRRDPSLEPLVAPATHFLSHAWNCSFKLLEEATAESSLYSYYTEGEFGKWSYYWCDVFIKNQHDPSPCDDEFISAIRDGRGTVAVLNTLNEAIPLTRIWCLFEYFHTIRLEKVLRFYLPFSEVEEYHKMTEKSTVNVMVEHSRATVASDKDRILAEIAKVIGINEMNQLLKDAVEKGFHLAESEGMYRENYYSNFADLLPPEVQP